MICPSRDRPRELVKAYESMLASSQEPHLVAYVDGDQRDLYLHHLQGYEPSLVGVRGHLIWERRTDSRLTIMLAEQIGSVNASNRICHFFREPFTIYGMIPDDSTFKTQDWDHYLIEKLDHNVPHVVSAAHNHGGMVNFPWVNRAWIEAVGWYYYPTNYHHCCDTIVEMIGECCNAITYADEADFLMDHEHKPSMNAEKFPVDALGFLGWCIGERREVVKNVKKRIAEATAAAVPA